VGGGCSAMAIEAVSAAVEAKELLQHDDEGEADDRTDEPLLNRR
jgi:hypothetical protein